MAECLCVCARWANAARDHRVVVAASSHKGAIGGSRRRDGACPPPSAAAAADPLARPGRGTFGFSGAVTAIITRTAVLFFCPFAFVCSKQQQQQPVKVPPLLLLLLLSFLLLPFFYSNNQGAAASLLLRLIRCCPKTTSIHSHANSLRCGLRCLSQVMPIRLLIRR